MLPVVHPGYVHLSHPGYVHLSHPGYINPGNEAQRGVLSPVFNVVMRRREVSFLPVIVLGNEAQRGALPPDLMWE